MGLASKVNTAKVTLHVSYNMHSYLIITTTEHNRASFQIKHAYTCIACLQPYAAALL